MKSLSYYRILTQKNSMKACGSDGIQREHFKDAGEEFYYPVTALIHAMLTQDLKLGSLIIVPYT